MARFLPFALAALSAVGLSTTAGSAFADAAAGASAPAFMGCQVAIGSKGMTLPSNAPALLVEDSSVGATATISAELVTGGVRTPLSAPTKDAHDLTIVTLPKTPEGSHVIATKVVCSNGQPDAEQETSLALTAPVAFPTSVGTLSVIPNGTPTGNDRIAIQASPELRAFQSIAIVDVNVALEGVNFTANKRAGIPQEFSVNTGRVCVENGALHREKRTVKVTVTAKLAGVADAPAPAVLDIPVDCGAIRWTSDSDFDNSTSKAPSTPGTGGIDNTAPQSSSASGCSAAPGGLHAGNGVLGAGVALALLVSFRRRRRA